MDETTAVNETAAKERAAEDTAEDAATDGYSSRLP